jgi:hypothetical protein
MVVMVIREYWEEVSDECYPGSNFRKVKRGHYVPKPGGGVSYPQQPGWLAEGDGGTTKWDAAREFRKSAVTRRGFVCDAGNCQFIFELGCFYGIRTFQEVSFEESV